MFENHRKSPIQHCERSELRSHFQWTKVNKKCQKWSNLASFRKPEACSQTELPDRSVLIVKNWWKMPKLKNSNATFLLIFKHCVVVTTDIFGDLWRTLMSDVEKQDLLSSSTNMNHKNSQKSWGLKMSICTLSILIVREKCSVDRSGD